MQVLPTSLSSFRRPSPRIGTTERVRGGAARNRVHRARTKRPRSPQLLNSVGSPSPSGVRGPAFAWRSACRRRSSEVSALRSISRNRASKTARQDNRRTLRSKCWSIGTPALNGLRRHGKAACSVIAQMCARRRYSGRTRCPGQPRRRFAPRVASSSRQSGSCTRRSPG